MYLSVRLPSRAPEVHFSTKFEIRGPRVLLSLRTSCRCVHQGPLSLKHSELGKVGLRALGAKQGKSVQMNI